MTIEDSESKFLIQSKLYGKRSILVVLFFLSYIHISKAQFNSHYWSHQYGSKGLLLNGAVIASVDDETAIFYNPGAMGITDDFGVSLSLITPTYSQLETRDFLGDGSNFIERGLGLSPGLVAAMFQPFGTDVITIGLTSFQRFKSQVSVEDRFVRPVSSNEDQLFLGEVHFNRRLTESWFGVGFSAKILDQLSLGVTQFVTFRGERVGLNFKKEILDRNNPANLIAGWRSNFEYGYSANGGGLSKIGLYWAPGKLKIGATYTSETFGLIDRGANYAFDDQKIFFDGDNTSASNDRSIRLADYQTPWSLGLGIEVPLGNSILSISAEYFAKLDKYDLINDVDDPLNGLSTETNLTTIVISQGNNEVLNVGLGIEQLINEKYTWFYGFRTDFSPRNLINLAEEISFLASTPNIYHISTGGAYSYRKSQFSVGLDYGFGFKVGGKQLTDISNITLDNIFEFSGEDSVNTFIHQISLFITYDL